MSSGALVVGIIVVLVGAVVAVIGWLLRSAVLELIAWLRKVSARLDDQERIQAAAARDRDDLRIRLLSTETYLFTEGTEEERRRKAVLVALHLRETSAEARSPVDPVHGPSGPPAPGH